MYYLTSVLARTSSGLENLTSSYLSCPSTLFVNLLDLTAICQSNKHTQSLIMESADPGSCSRHHLSELFYSLCSPHKSGSVGLSRACYSISQARNPCPFRTNCLTHSRLLLFHLGPALRPPPCFKKDSSRNISLSICVLSVPCRLEACVDTSADWHAKGIWI